MSGLPDTSAPAATDRLTLEHGSVVADRSARDQCPWVMRYPRRPARARARYRRVKRAIDLAVVLSATPFWAPPTLAVAALIKAGDPSADVLFRQWRTGAGATRFRMLKFRTMVPDADRLKATLQHLNTRVWPDFKVDDDPRVTRLGRILRATSLDELPQLLNVLRGQMSLVGPRPTSLAPARYQQWQLERFDVPSGLTGLWQIEGRGNPSFVERVRLDVAYVERQCLRLDLEILLRTVPVVLTRRGAG